MATKQCSKCKVEFACSAPVSGCWCEQYSLTAKTLAELKDTYADCLCPGCLAHVAETLEDNPAGQNI